MKQGKWSSAFLLLLATAVLLPLCFPPFYCAFLAPIALVPFTVVVLRRPMNVKHLLAYWMLGAAFFGPNLFWLSPVTFGGYIALALFVALYFPLYAFAVRRLVVDFRMPATLGVAIAWTVMEYLRSTLFWGGFPWFHLGNCLAPVPMLIQIADLFGVWGVSFVLAMCNGLVVDLLRMPLVKFDAARQNRGFNPGLGALIATVVIACAFTVAYGVVRMNQPSAISEGPRVAVIQENIPQKVKDNIEKDRRREIFDRHMALTRQAAATEPKPAMIVWPETMVPGQLNAEFLNYGLVAESMAGRAQQRSRLFLEELGALAVDRDVNLLVGATGVRFVGEEGVEVQNRAFLITPAWVKDRNPAVLYQRELPSYAKVHLVPFGEFVPMSSVPWIHRLLLKLTPYGEDYSNKPGEEWTRFSLGVKGGDFGVPICFEDVMPYPSRYLAKAGRERPKADFLVNISNEGWFHSQELDQHLQAAQMRAVENRVPMARSVNAGNSGFIDSHGRIVKLVTGADGRSAGAVGFAVLAMPVDARVTLYTRIGDLFPVACGVLATLCVGWTFVRPRRKVVEREASPEATERV